MRRGGVPVLRPALAWFAGEIEQPVQVHDHTLFLARGLDCEWRSGSPLMFWDSRYRQPFWAD